MVAKSPVHVVADEPATSHAQAEKKKTKSKSIRRKQATFQLNAQEFSFVKFDDVDDTLHLAP